jgi:hypothetical protein
MRVVPLRRQEPNSLQYHEDCIALQMILFVVYLKLNTYLLFLCSSGFWIVMNSWYPTLAAEL